MFTVAQLQGGGQLITPIVAAASTNATSVKASAGAVYGLAGFNNAAYPVYLRLFNKASAPTMGTDTPVYVIGIPAGGGFICNFAAPLIFATGIALAITKAIANLDATAVAASDCTISLQYS